MLDKMLQFTISFFLQILIFFYENVATFQLNLINVIPLYMTVDLIVFYLLTALPHVFEVSKGDLRVGGRNRLITVLSRVHSQQHHQSLLGKGLQFDTFSLIKRRHQFLITNNVDVHAEISCKQTHKAALLVKQLIETTEECS